MNIRQLARRIRLALTGRIDCAPRTDRLAPYPELDASGGPGFSRMLVIEPLSPHTERVWYGPSKAADTWLRRTPAYYRYEDEQLARTYLRSPTAARVTPAGAPR